MPLVKMEKMETWKVIVNAAEIRSYEPVLELSKVNIDGLPLELYYHRECYQYFTMKSLLKRIKEKKEVQKVQEAKNLKDLNSLIDQTQSYVTSETVLLRRSSSASNSLASNSSTTGSSILPDTCIICNTKVKYYKRERESLRLCIVKQPQTTLQRFATERSDYRMQSLLSTVDLIAAEAKYHPSCYVEYTRPKYKKKALSIETTEYKQCELEAFHIVIGHCHEMICKQTILKLNDMTTIMKDHLRKNGKEITNSTKKNLRSNIEKTFGNEITIINVSRNVLLYPTSIPVETAISELSKSTEEDSVIMRVASIIRKELKDLKDELPWPPKPADLEPDKFKIPPNLNEFLTHLLGVKDEILSSTKARLRHSLAQDIVYIVNGGRIKTPKSVLLPSVIKTLTNNTEIINIINRLGHGVSYSILSEMHTENAFRIQEQQLGDIVIPEEASKETFTIYVGDNIDRTEETLTGIGFYLRFL